MGFANGMNDLLGRSVCPIKPEKTNYLRGSTGENDLIHPKVNAIYQTGVKDTSKGEYGVGGRLQETTLCEERVQGSTRQRAVGNGCWIPRIEVWSMDEQRFNGCMISAP